MESEKLSAEFISQKENLAEIYKLIAKAAQNTLPPDDSDSKFLVEFNDKSRFTPRNIRNNATKDIKISYSPQNICITGGSALNIYDLALEEYRKRKTITPLKEFVNRSTPDIDIVWWPTVTGTDSNKYAVISVSPIIHNFITRLEKQLDESFSYLIGKQYRVFDTIYTVNRVKISNNFADSGQRPAGYKYGTHQLKISIQINDTLIHIVDFSIYDSASGQTKPQQSLLPMNKDPVYMNQSTIKTLQIHDIHVNVPEIKHLIKQQIFAFNNIYPINPMKGMVIYKRILYIKELIYKANSQNNIQDIHNVLGNIGNIPIKSITDTLNKNSINSLENVSRVIEEEIIKTVHPVNPVKNSKITARNRDELIAEYNAVTQRLIDLDIEYNKIRLDIEAPLRTAKRNEKKTHSISASRHTQHVKNSIAPLIEKVKKDFDEKKKELEQIKLKLEAELDNTVDISRKPLLSSPSMQSMPPMPSMQSMPSRPPMPSMQSMPSRPPMPPMSSRPPMPPMYSRPSMQTRPPMPPMPHIQIFDEYYNDAGQLIALVKDTIHPHEYEVFIEILPTGQKRLRFDIPVLKTVGEYVDAQGNRNYLILDPFNKQYMHLIINRYTGKKTWENISPYDYERLIGSIRR
jgi:hypothetical protein